MTFSATKAPVYNRGVPPDDFLTALVAFGQSEDPSVFAPNAVYDIYSEVEQYLGPWTAANRPAAMLEVLRVIGGFESSWNWNQGVDTTNAASMANITGQETGIFQVSFDSVNLDDGTLCQCLQKYIPSASVTGSGYPSTEDFITNMKSNHALAIEYCARLFRINVAWSGPIIGKHAQPYLSPAAMAEFESLLSATP